jgi:hypothetical protein
MKNLEFIKKGEDVLAIIIYDNFRLEGVNFFTPEDFPQQLGFISQKTGKIIEPHTHKIVKREIFLTQEVLIIKRGKIKLDLYDSKNNYFDSRILSGGDVVLLTGGGHGYEVLEDVDMIEIKQGPYLGKNDKIRFKDIEDKKL